MALIVAGAVYRPVDETEPTPGEAAQDTFVLSVPVTVAASWMLAPAVTVADGGATLTATLAGGNRFIVAVPAFVGSAALVAITVIVCAAATVAGAVYTPLVAEIVPTNGDTDHVTLLLFPAPVTLAVKAWV